ncbi:MAG: ATP synthase F1 subunit gamma [Verrucomicrobiae bacterium]|nr:ATP synthase F1 subunit gamma [Verrucomicrobiae bacterium]
MPSTRDIRRRIKSVRNTAQITRAMQMVAASKMRKAQQAALAGRPYAQAMDEVLRALAADEADIAAPEMHVREVRQRGVILVTTDRGLCGSLNANLLREAAKFDRDNTQFIAVGRKGAQFLGRTKRRLVAEFPYKDVPSFDEARAIAKFAKELFLKGEVDRVDVLFTKFVSTLTQTPEQWTLLPVGERPAVTAAGGARGSAPSAAATLFAFEPSAKEVMGALLPHYLNFEMYHILLEARASEHSARMVAMKNATENAEQLIKDLTLDYNKMRQAAITNELLEISTAQMALG